MVLNDCYISTTCEIIEKFIPTGIFKVPKSVPLYVVLGDDMDNKIFTIGVSLSGSLGASFCFENENDYNQWLTNDLPLLEKEYGIDNLTLYRFELAGLKVGDTCCVHGEGWDTFVIEGVKQYSPHRYGFILDSGWCEEVVKCWVREI